MEKRIGEIFLRTISKLNKEEDVSQFLREFLTPTEKIVLSKRLAVAVMLRKGCDYKKIREVLKVTPGTIARVAYWIKYSKSGFLKIANVIVDGEKSEDFWNEIGNSVVKVLSLQKEINRVPYGGTHVDYKGKESTFNFHYDDTYYDSEEVVENCGV